MVGGKREWQNLGHFPYIFEVAVSIVERRFQ
jgi:hypothetical protein